MMNTRALALGVVIGFVAAFAPSCGGGKCGPNNCGGCCDKAGKCVAKPNNANNTTCGSAGNACADCSTTMTACNPTTFTCGSGTGGGAGGGTGGGTGGGGTGGGGGGTCDGCKLPNGTCVPLSATSVNNCGFAGANCAACMTGQLCTNGVCTTPMTMKKIGDPCTTDMECQSITGVPTGGQIICKKMTSTGNGTYTGGYCTVRCGSGTPLGSNGCPSGSTCIGVDPRYGETDVFCWDRCGTGDPCRTPGYACYTVGGSISACWINPLPQQDAGPPADKIGNTCTADTQCQNPPDRGGACYGVSDPNNADGLDNRTSLGFLWPGGYCSKEFCDTDTECGANGRCITFGGTESRCVRHCAMGGSATDAGQSDCRMGYRCFSVTQSDGGPTPDGICLGGVAPLPARTGQSCTTSNDCAVPTGAVADCIPGALPDGGASTYTGGYCSRFGCQTTSECGNNAADAGNLCLTISAQGDTACFERCAAGGAGQSTCRMGYVCQSYTSGGMTSMDGYCTPNCNNVPNSCGLRADGGTLTCSAQGYCQ